MEVNADDTDIAVMLIRHWNDSMQEIVFNSPQAKKSWSIKESSMALTPEWNNLMTFIHAVSGCDTTSAVFGLGKCMIL